MPEARNHPTNGINTVNPSPDDQYVNINGMVVIAKADPCSFYTILNKCPAHVRLGEEIKISRNNGESKARGRVIEGPIFIDGKETSGQIIYVGTFLKNIMGWKQLHDLDWMKEYTNGSYLTDVPPVLIKGAKDPENVRQTYLIKHLLEDAKRVTNSWVREGYIEMCDSVCNSQVSLGKKRNRKVNIKFHFENLNTFSEKEPSHPRENMPKTIESITLGKYYSFFKLFYGEWQIPLDTYTKYKTAFDFLGKQYVWNRLPGNFHNKNGRLCDALQKVLDKLPHNMSKRVTFYVDTILLSADTKEECDKFSKKVLEHLEDHSFQVRHRQSQICKPKVVFIGREINEEGVALSKEFIHKVKNMVTSPRNLRELQSILGHLNEAREYTPGYGILSNRLSKLTGKSEFYWDDEEEDLLNRLKAQILVKRFLVPGLAENEACTVQIFVKDRAWMARILNRAGKPYRYKSGVFEPLMKKDNFATQELKAMKGVWETHGNILESRDVEWEVESADIETYKDNINRVTNGKQLKLDFLMSERCKIKVVQADGRQPPTPWSEVL